MPRPNSGDTSSGEVGTGGDVVGGGEFRAIERIARRLGPAPAGDVGIGDDAAVVGSGPGSYLLATDLTVAGVHADLERIGLDDFGWRAVTATVSDIAAMGARPGRAVVAVAGPPSTDLDELYEGIAQAAAAYGCPVVGGDLANASQVVVAVTASGSVPAGGRPVLRSGARAGDVLFVTGPLGAAAAGLRLLGRPPGSGSEALIGAYRRPAARLAEGEAARLAGATAMIDVSDGLSADLSHLSDASHVGLALDNVPVYAGAALEDALGGGDDYELAFTAPPRRDVLGAFGRAGLRAPQRIGRCVAQQGTLTLEGEPLPVRGWEHRWS